MKRFQWVGLRLDHALSDVGDVGDVDGYVSALSVFRTWIDKERSFCYSQYQLKTSKTHNNVLFHVSPVTFLECMAGLLSCSLVSHIPTLRDVVAPIRARDLVLTLSSLLVIVYPLRLLKVIKILWVLLGKGPSFFRSKHVSGNN